MKQARLNEGVRSALLKDNTPLAATEAKPSTCNVVYKNNKIVFSRAMNCSSKDPIFVCHYQLQCSCKVAGKIEYYTFSPYSMHDKHNQNVPFFFSSQAARNGTKMTSNKS